LTFRSAVTGSGVVVDDTGEGVTLFGVQPVLRTAVSLKKSFLYFQILLFLFHSKFCINLNKIIEILISYVSLYKFLILIDLTVQIRTKKLKIIGLMD
jgi:hypothetical protein